MDVLNLEKEQKRLARYEEWHKAQRMNYPELLQQRKLVTALEQLEQAREALEKIRGHQEFASPTGCQFSATWNIAVKAINALKQQEVGHE